MNEELIDYTLNSVYNQTFYNMYPIVRPIKKSRSESNTLFSDNYNNAALLEQIKQDCRAKTTFISRDFDKFI